VLGPDESRDSREASVAICDIVVRSLSSSSLMPSFAAAARRHKRCNGWIGDKRGNWVLLSLSGVMPKVCCMWCCRRRAANAPQRPGTE